MNSTAGCNAAQVALPQSLILRCNGDDGNKETKANASAKGASWKKDPFDPTIILLLIRQFPLTLHRPRQRKENKRCFFHIIDGWNIPYTLRASRQVKRHWRGRRGDGRARLCRAETRFHGNKSRIDRVSPYQTRRAAGLQAAPNSRWPASRWGRDRRWSCPGQGWRSLGLNSFHRPCLPG